MAGKRNRTPYTTTPARYSEIIIGDIPLSFLKKYNNLVGWIMEISDLYLLQAYALDSHATSNAL